MRARARPAHASMLVPSVGRLAGHTGTCGVHGGEGEAVQARQTALRVIETEQTPDLATDM
eukprot:1346697-Pleurochrysis_carterae.AAC.1